MLFLRLRAKPVKKKAREVRLEKRSLDPDDRTRRKEDYEYQQLKDFRHGVKRHPEAQA
jgi:hypothetical protein